MVVQNLVAAGIKGSDVASPAEIALIRRLAPGAAMHYNNPVRARHEIEFAVAQGVVSYSVDSHSELEKLIEIVPAANTEITVRFKLPVNGAAYNFGAKFGATVELASELLKRVAEAGFLASLTFHPGTQCTDPMAWTATSARLPTSVSVQCGRPSLECRRRVPFTPRGRRTSELDAIFVLIDEVATEAFGANRPSLVCEPGRGLVAESFASAARVKAVRDAGCVS